MAAGHFVHAGQVSIARGTNLHAVGFVRPIGNEVNAELALRVLDGGVGFARRNVNAFGEELEVVNQLFHVGFHVFAGRRRHLVVLGDDRTRILAQPLNTLLDDAVGLEHFLHPDQVAIIAVAIDPDRHVEINLVVGGVGLLLAQIPGKTRTAEHGAREAHLQRTLGADHADIDQALFPDPVVGQQRMVLAVILREAVGEILEEVEQGTTAILVQFPGLLGTGPGRFLISR